MLDLLCIAIGASVTILFFRGRARWPLLPIAIAGAALVPAALHGKSADRPSSTVVSRTSPGEYVSSGACRSCHPSEYESWHRSFHRTMTQSASVDTVAAPLDGAMFERRGARVWTTGDGPLELVTGSHRQQAYWVRGERGTLKLLPIVYLLSERRTIARRDAFLQPPDAAEREVHWNSNCIQCHSVAGEPRLDQETDRFSTRAVELGIPCEACHGPGGEHVRKHRDPFARYAQPDAADPTIVQPARLSAERASQVCGQCHSYAYPHDEDDWWQHGYSLSYRPGGDLERSRSLLGRAGGPSVDAPLESIFWQDGTVRVGGREYNGMVLSACYREGHGDEKLRCEGCHSMHDSEPGGQLAHDRPGDAACLRCHSAIEPAHTRHAPESPGSRCVECHMPRTSYALLRAVRSHRIERPSADGERLPACNLCHVERSLAWSRAQLRNWTMPMGMAPSAPPDDGPSALAEWALHGDAAKRAIAADHALPRAVVETLTHDPYAAVRFIAARSLSTARDFPIVLPAAGTRDDRPITISE